LFDDPPERQSPDGAYVLEPDTIDPYVDNILKARKGIRVGPGPRAKTLRESSTLIEEFKLYVPRMASGIRPGTVSINGNGQARFNIADLLKIGIENVCTILVGDRKIALRKPKDDEPIMHISKNKSGGTGKVSIKGPMSVIGIQAKTAKMSIESGMIILAFN